MTKIWTGKPSNEDIEEQLEKFQQISLFEEEWREFCDVNKAHYSSIHSFRNGFYRWLERKQPSDSYLKDLSKVNLEYLHPDELQKHVKSKDQTIIEIENKLKSSGMQDSEALRIGKIVMEDETLFQVFESMECLKTKWGPNWERSFLRTFTKFLYRNAMVESGQGHRYLNDDEYLPILSWLKTAFFLGGGRLYQLLHGDGNLKDSKFTGFHPIEHNLPLPSKSTIEKIISFTNRYGDTFDDMRNTLDGIIIQLKKKYRTRYVIIKYDAIYLKKTIIVNKSTRKIVGLARGPVLYEEWIQKFNEIGVNVIKDENFINQAYTFVIATPDHAFSQPFYYYGFEKDDYEVIEKALDDAILYLLNQGIFVCALCSDGGSSCKKALRQYQSRIKFGGRICTFVDMDHLMKTIRNKLAKGTIKCNSQKLRWDIIITEWKKHDSSLSKSICFNALYPEKDKMNSKWMREILNNSDLFEHLLTVSESLNGDEKRDYINLSMFLSKCSSYIKAWEDLGGRNITHKQRYDQILDATRFFSGEDKTFIISDLTPKAKESLQMNSMAWKKMLDFATQTGILPDLNWRSFSTMIVENFYSMIRAETSAPTWYDFGRTFSRCSEELQKSWLNHESRGFSMGDRIRRGTGYGKDTSTAISSLPKYHRKSSPAKMLPKQEKRRLSSIHKVVSKQVREVKNSIETGNGIFRGKFKATYTTDSKVKIQK